MNYWPSTKLLEYEERNGLYEPLILPSFIPDGYVQHWNPHTRSYYLTSAKGIMGKYQPKRTPMDEEVIVEETVEAPVEAETAPEAPVEAEVEETTV